MKLFARRRIRSLLLAAMVIATIAFALRWWDLQLGRVPFASGYLLYGLVAFLALFNLRKKIPTLPVGSASSWLQLHLYVGLIAGAVFGMHLSWRLPNGWLETFLSISFMMTFMSGLLGLRLTRSLPRLLSRAGDEVVYERIPQLRRYLSHTSRATVLQSVSSTGSTTLANFYTAQLFDFFAKPRSVGYFLFPSSRRRRTIMQQMGDLKHYLTPDEQSACEKLFGLVRKKDDLDFHQARQRLLKLWMFGHIGMTYVLITMATTHALLVHLFRGDAL